jgi:acyl-CoA synthetase (AMP-forming)/AMP-acid ligase II
MNFGMLIRKSAAMFGANDAVICGEQTLSYAELYVRSCRLAQALAGLGLAPGERIALLTDNCLQVPEIKVGLAVGGYVRAGLYTHNSVESNRYLLELTGARALIVQPHHLEPIAPLLEELDEVREVIVIDGEGDVGHDYESLLAAASSEDPMIPVEPEDVHQIRFSAGTTGKPKGIAHTTGGWMAMGSEFALGLPRLDEDDRYLAAGPLTHAATMPFWPVLTTGGAVVVVPTFEAGAVLELIEWHRCTLTLVVPTMIQMLVNHADAETRDLSSLRAVIYGAAPIAERTLTEAIGVWGNVMYQIYGQSEAIPATVLAPRDHRPDGDERERRWLRSAGRPTPYVVLSVLDEQGNELPPGELGEIAIFTPGRMSEIWGDPKATTERLLADGRVLTRDVGYLDEDGFLYLADRKDDLIISGGFNIWPAEIENALADHPAVQAAGVVGIPHEKWGETPVAAVVLRPGAEVTEQELTDWTRERLGSVKKITAVRFVEELPKSGVGKVLRREIRQLWSATETTISGA